MIGKDEQMFCIFWIEDFKNYMWIHFWIDDKLLYFHFLKNFISVWKIIENINLNVFNCVRVDLKQFLTFGMLY